MQEGFVACDQYFERIAIVSPTYKALCKILFSCSKDPRESIPHFHQHFLPLAALCNGKDFADYFPEWIEDFKSVKDKFIRLCNKLDKDYAPLTTLDTKEFALAIQFHPLKSLLFQLKKLGCKTSAEELIAKNFFHFFNDVNLTKLLGSEV
jgi:hypothetical protein